MQDKFTFITNRKDHAISDSRIVCCDSLSPVLDYLKHVKQFNYPTGLDTENNSLNPMYAVPILAQIGDRENTFVIDRTSVDIEFIEDYTDVEYLGVNLQYDCAIIAWNEGRKRILLRRLKDLMIHEQVIGRGIRRPNSLEGMHLRRLGIVYPEKKEIGKEFIKMNKRSILHDEHIIYAGTDIKVLKDIYDIQLPLIQQAGLERRIFDIANPYIAINAERLLNGTALDKEKWYAIYLDNKKKKLEWEQELDKELKSLGYRTKVRQRQDLLVLDLFSTVAGEVANQNVNNINYNSDLQILKIFNFFMMPVPMGRDIKTHELKPSTGGDALEQYNIDNPGNKLTRFIKLLVEYKGILKRLNSFGLNFLHDVYPDPSKPNAKNNLIRGFYNRITNKVHTKYKQEFTANGRNSSGSDKDANGKSRSKKKSDTFFNSQQLPKEARYRECFILEERLIHKGWTRLTLDLAGAELIILGALSGDRKLLDLQEKDLHSHLSTKAFTNIIKYILSNMNESRIRMELYDLLKVNKVFEILAVTEKDERGEEKFIRFYTQEEKDAITRGRIEEALKTGAFLINKNTAKDIRDAVKNAVYASIYGANAERLATTLGIAKDYAQIVLDTFRAELPVSFGFLRDVAKTAVRDGYVIFNKRTNSRHIFNIWLEAQKYGKELTNSQKAKISRDAMNYIISGTQADMIKESEVEVDKYLKNNNIEHDWIFQVHDEFVLDIEPSPIDLEDKKQRAKHIVNIEKITLDTCNKYLNGLAEMKANCVTANSWVK